MKYKACCGMRCARGHCETRDAGGCYCICRLVDAIHDMERIIDGTLIRIHGMLSYIPDPIRRAETKARMTPEKAKEEEDYKINVAPKILETLKEKLKGYETK